MTDFIVKCRVCKNKKVVPDQCLCTDLEYDDYLKVSNINCKCGKNDWEILID